MYASYQLVRHREEDGTEYLALHKVYYSLDDRAHAIGRDPAQLYFDNEEDARHILEQIASGEPPVDYDSLPKISGQEEMGEVVYAAPGELPEQNAEGSYALN